MDYLKLSRALTREYREKRSSAYQRVPVVVKVLLLIILFPLRVSFFISRLVYWFTWFFFKGLSAPVDYLQVWLDSQKEGLGDITHAVLYLVCLPTIFSQKVVLAFNSFAFFFQWFGLMLSAYILTLGTIKWQPVVTEALFEEKYYEDVEVEASEDEASEDEA